MSRKGEDFEKQLKRLQAVVTQLEAGDLPLEKGLALYKEGLVLAKACRTRLEEAKNEITLVTEKGIREFEPEEGGDGSGQGEA